MCLRNITPRQKTKRSVGVYGPFPSLTLKRIIIYWQSQDRSTCIQRKLNEDYVHNLLSRYIKTQQI